MLLFLMNIACGGSENNLVEQNPDFVANGSTSGTTATTTTANPDRALAVNFLNACFNLGRDLCPAPTSGGTNLACGFSVFLSNMALRTQIETQLPAGKTMADFLDGTVPFYLILSVAPDSGLLMSTIVFQPPNDPQADVAAQLAQAFNANYHDVLFDYGLVNTGCDAWVLQAPSYDLTPRDVRTFFDDGTHSTPLQTAASCDDDTVDSRVVINGLSYPASQYETAATCAALEAYRADLFPVADVMLWSATTEDPEALSHFVILYYNGVDSWIQIHESDAF